MRELAGQYPRYGYRKIRIFLARRGHPMSAERTYRLWRQAGPARAASAPAAAGDHSSPSAAAPNREESRVGL